MCGCQGRVSPRSDSPAQTPKPSAPTTARTRRSAPQTRAGARHTARSAAPTPSWPLMQQCTSGGAGAAACLRPPAYVTTGHRIAWRAGCGECTGRLLCGTRRSEWLAVAGRLITRWRSATERSGREDGHPAPGGAVWAGGQEVPGDRRHARHRARCGGGICQMRRSREATRHAPHTRARGAAPAKAA